MKNAGEKEREVEETPVPASGYLGTAAFPYNPSFFARPNNTGLVGLRHMLRLEIDFYKQYLTFYTDQTLKCLAHLQKTRPQPAPHQDV